MKEKLIWAVKHLGIFAVLYILSAVIGEMLVIVGFSIGGFDVLHGDMPDGYWVGLIPLYGFVIYLTVTLIYVKCVAKKRLVFIRLTLNTKTPGLFLAGSVGGGIAVAAAVGILTVTNDYRFAGAGGTNLTIALATLIAFIIQGATEEIMCRGFLQNFLEQRLSRPAAILVTALAFTAPHVLSFESEPLVIAVSVCNLLLVSVLFSLTMIRWNSLWVPIGFHIGWNYTLSYIFGLQLSGMSSKNNLFLFQINSGRNWLHGGSYGIEAGLLATFLLLFLNIVLYLTGKDKLKNE